jgi:hypothetical protein
MATGRVLMLGPIVADMDDESARAVMTRIDRGLMEAWGVLHRVCGELNRLEVTFVIDNANDALKSLSEAMNDSYAAAFNAGLRHS